jgi:CubicO group peptidase (beta-lactamase class C family)
MIVERVTGDSFRSFMENNIFIPLGMKSTFVVDEPNLGIKNRVTGYSLIGEKDDYNAFTTGGGGMYSTTEDLYLWDQALSSNRLISKDASDEAFSSTILNDGTISNYGFGWMIEYVNNYKSVYHTGGLVGFRTIIHKDLMHNNAIILLSNKGNANALKYISRAIQDIICKTSLNEYKFPISLKLFKISQNQEIEQIINTFKKIAETNNGEFDISEIQLNKFGYMLLMDRREEDALEVFKYNLELNPQIGNF